MRLCQLLCTYLLTLLLAFFLSHSAYASQAHEVTSIPPGVVTSKHIATSNFYAVNVYGRLNLEINAGRSPSVQVTSNALARSTLRVVVKNGALYVIRKTKTNYRGCYKKIALFSPILVKINVPQLAGFKGLAVGKVRASNLRGPLVIDIKGNVSALFTGCNIDLRNLDIGGLTSITIAGINSRCLCIEHDGMGKINLQGIANLQSLMQYGEGDVILPYVVGPCVKISAGGIGKVCIAGRTCVFKATLCDGSYLNAKCMYATRGFVDTHDLASAEIWGATDTLILWATECSNIYYYHDSDYVSRNMIPPGNIIGMDKVCNELCCPPKKLYR